MDNPLKPKKQKKLNAAAMLFVMKQRGQLTDKKIAVFTEKLSHKIKANDATIHKALDSAVEIYQQGGLHVFVCHGSDCKKKKGMALIEECLQEIELLGDIKITKTLCQGACKLAPMANVRVGQCCKVFTKLKKKGAWEAIRAMIESIE